MATSSIGYYLVPNQTGKTTGSFIRIIPNGVANFADIVSDVTSSLSTTEQRLKIVWNETIKVALEHVVNGYTVDLGTVRMMPHIPGAMTYEDQPFDSDVDTVVVETYTDGELASVFDGVIPYRVSAESAAEAIKVSNVMDMATEQFGTVIGTGQFAVLGNAVTLDGTDEYVKANNRKTGEFIQQATVDRVERGQRAYCHFPTSLSDGEVTLEIATHGLSGETSLRKFTKNVTAVHVAYPPTITKAYPSGFETQLDKVLNNGDNVIEGTNLLGSRIYKNSVSEENELATTAVSTETKLVYEGCGLTAGTAFKILVANADGTAERNVTAISPLTPTITSMHPKDHSELTDVLWEGDDLNIVDGTNFNAVTGVSFKYTDETTGTEKTITGTIEDRSDTGLEVKFAGAAIDNVGNLVLAYSGGEVSRSGTLTFAQ